MKSISFEGIGAVVATFGVAESVPMGQVVKLSEGKTVEPCEAGDKFIGVVFDCDSPLASVQVGGFTTLPCTGAVELGHTTLVADGNGGVKAGAGASYLVVDYSEDGTVTLCL